MGYFQTERDLSSMSFAFDLIDFAALDSVPIPIPPPLPIIIHIFKYLNPSDLKIVALVCRRFLSACMYKKLSKNFMLNFVDSYYKEFSVQISQFVDTFRIFPAISVNTGNFDVASQSFWLDYGLNIEEIYFRNGILRKHEFEDIIRWTPNIRVLKIEANNIFRTWDVKGTYSERLHNFENCYHISLAKNSFLNRKIFDFVVSKAPNLREIDLSFCMNKLQASERNAMLDHFIFYLKGYGETVKLINLRQTEIDDFFLQALSEVKRLKLTSLSITFNGATNNRKFGIIPLINSQNLLEELDIQDSSAVEENVLMELSKVCKKLRRLNLRKCAHITDYCLREIVKLNHLEALDITSCDLVTDEGIHDALLCGTPKKQLRELHFGMLSHISERIFARLGTKLHNQLTILDLGGSTNLADDALQTIFCHFPMIRFLSLDSCCKITDYGITGKFQTQNYFSIKLLQGLRVLRLQNCYKITDFALVDSFEFKELKEVYFARTHFQREGIEAMVKNCPAIEILDLSEVANIDDDVVEIITKNLQRLQILKLNGNDKITATSFDHIYKHCKDIKNLYLRNCPNLNTERLTDQLHLMRSLRKVYLE
ncbi:CLUMA_CG003860, isoform A [Clunio marinus]|uniref:CLUMA_CG003860, isoform A n=1 Tax=Clunio marinus TaxID=568069 RepID=A0A1J1HQ08_9DIPT|nr:CLUMA_CG003860, isoform A [Clunio marinus]